jgi:hypothetical protein
MILVKLTTQNSYNALVQLFSSFWATAVDSTLFVNGQRASSAAPWLAQPGNEPLYGGMTFVGVQSPSNLCIAITTQSANNVGMKAWDCGFRMSCYCEFNKYSP